LGREEDAEHITIQMATSACTNTSRLEWVATAVNIWTVSQERSKITIAIRTMASTYQNYARIFLGYTGHPSLVPKRQAVVDACKNTSPTVKARMP